MKNALVFMAAAVAMLSVACNPPGVTLVLENDFDFEYFDFQTQEAGEVEGFISSESAAFSPITHSQNGSDSFIVQRMFLTFSIDTGQYNVSVPAFKGVTLSFNKRIEFADATVIGSDDWERPIYSYSNPEQYLTDFFPEGNLGDVNFDFDLMLDAYGYLTSVETTAGASGEDDFMITRSEIRTDNNNRQFVYVEGQFTGKTISMGYPTVALQAGTIIEITQGNFKGKWPIN